MLINFITDTYLSPHRYRDIVIFKYYSSLVGILHCNYPCCNVLLHTCVLQPPPAYVHPSPLIFDMFCSLDSGPVTRLSCQPAHFYQRWNARTAPVFTSHLTHLILTVTKLIVIL